MRQGGPIPEAPTEGSGGAGSGGVALSDAIGFVTEFNENVQIFNGAAEIVQGAAALVIAGLIEVAQLKPTIESNKQKIITNEAAIRVLFNRIESLSPRLVYMDNKIETLLGPNGGALSSDLDGGY